MEGQKQGRNIVMIKIWLIIVIIAAVVIKQDHTSRHKKKKKFKGKIHQKHWNTADSVLSINIVRERTKSLFCKSRGSHKCWLWSPDSSPKSLVALPNLHHLLVCNTTEAQKKKKKTVTTASKLWDNFTNYGKYLQRQKDEESKQHCGWPEAPPHPHLPSLLIWSVAIWAILLPHPSH